MGRRHACGQAWRGGIRHAWCSAHPGRPAGRPEEFAAATAMPWRTVWDVEMFRQREKKQHMELWIDQKPRRKHIYPYLWSITMARYYNQILSPGTRRMHASMGHMTCHVLA